MHPSVSPSTTPIASSCRSTRNQSFTPICCSASAREISVAACEPELPPVEMHRGTNRLSTTTAAIASSNADSAVNVNSSAPNRHDSQNARFRHSLKKLVWR